MRVAKPRKSGDSQAQFDFSLDLAEAVVHSPCNPMASLNAANPLTQTPSPEASDDHV
ncbi:hypothetical protein MCEMSEM23_01542 [Rhabdaerophilaceae bacterium]